jgi:hypothetical protein
MGLKSWLFRRTVDMFSSAMPSNHGRTLIGGLDVILPTGTTHLYFKEGDSRVPTCPIFCHTEELRSRPSWLYLVPWLVSFDGDGLAASAAAAVCAKTAPFIIPKHAL